MDAAVFAVQGVAERVGVLVEADFVGWGVGEFVAGFSGVVEEFLAAGSFIWRAVKFSLGWWMDILEEGKNYFLG